MDKFHGAGKHGKWKEKQEWNRKAGDDSLAVGEIPLLSLGGAEFS